ncbi:TRAP transporter small permease subunit [Halochromatium salexigens]|uniref:TRAP transporter small permease protein n=1 Tax=Halochromatium salexigens TaxID=49447 RepID=A0AAJ0XES8_HALSE|nr:TRAP transporter small permease subunit [Halochromatium salexigens]MBK5930224.1 C4-dicarboxylate ABC transporter permease [Halochromatium salexigens]
MSRASAPGVAHALARHLPRLADGLDWVNRAVGTAVAWLALAMVLVTFIVVVLRYGFDAGSIALQESITYMHATLFMLGVAYTLRQDAHVRVDILYQRFTRRGRAWVDLLGTLFLLTPVCVFLFIASWEYVADAWSVREGSREAGGLPGVWLLKTLLLVMPVLMLLQGLIWVLRNGLFIAGFETEAVDQPPVDQAPDSLSRDDDEPNARRESRTNG